MSDSGLIIVIFGGFIVAIWLSYKFFMRGFTDKEKIAGLMPADFKPDMHYELGDTYLGYETASKRLVVIDWPRAKVVAPSEVTVTPEDEVVVGIRHRWLVVGVNDPNMPRLRVWFRFAPKARDEWVSKLNALKAS